MRPRCPGMEDTSLCIDCPYVSCIMEDETEHDYDDRQSKKRRSKNKKDWRTGGKWSAEDDDI